jgi:hypothetical protein
MPSLLKKIFKTTHFAFPRIAPCSPAGYRKERSETNHDIWEETDGNRVNSVIDSNTFLWDESALGNSQTLHQEARLETIPEEEQ